MAPCCKNSINKFVIQLNSSPTETVKLDFISGVKLPKTTKSYIFWVLYDVVVNIGIYESFQHFISIIYYNTLFMILNEIRCKTPCDNQYLYVICYQMTVNSVSWASEETSDGKKSNHFVKNKKLIFSFRICPSHFQMSLST